MTATALGLAVLPGGGLLWLRDSSWMTVRDVSITGLTGRSAPAVRAALLRAAGDMTTLHVRRDELARAAAPFPVVKDLTVSVDLPHRLRIEVVEYDPVAAVEVAGRRVPVTSDGTFLRDEPAEAALPTVSGGRGLGATRLTDRGALDSVAVLGAAPAALRPLIDRVGRDGAGIHVTLRSGPRLDFGRPRAVQAKWAAAAGVLADPRAAGAAYLDLRVPDRPVGGPFPAEESPVAPLGQPSDPPEEAGG